MSPEGNMMHRGKLSLIKLAGAAGLAASMSGAVTAQEVCIPRVIDFETDGAGNPLLHGQSLVTPGPEVPFTCPSITSGPNPIVPGNGHNGAAVFDSTTGPFGQDPDLNVNQGKLLYLQANGGNPDSFTGVNGPDTWDFPNDDADGGVLTFSFCDGVRPLSVDLVDIDLPLGMDVDVTLTDSNGFSRVYAVPGGWTDDGPGATAVGTLDLQATGNQPGIIGFATEATDPGYDGDDIVVIEFLFYGSGALDNFTWCEPCTPCILECPDDVTIDCSDSTDPANTGMPTGCGSATFEDAITPGDCDGNFTITRTWMADDGCGGTATCVQTITVTDTTAPDITCPGDLSLDCSDSTDPADTGMATATDDCSGVADITFDDDVAAGDCAGNFVITRTWTAVDNCGNTSSCMQTITVTDTTPPDLTCPPDMTFVGCCLLPDIGVPTATDDCGTVSVSSDAPPEFCLGDTIVTWTAMDDCGNTSTCMQTITVVPVCLDFEGDGNGDPLAHGQNLETAGPETAFTCPTISSGPDPVSPGNGNNGLAVFDSTNGPFGQDPDLGVGQGNVLILQANGGNPDSFTGVNGVDTWDFPNDDEDGGTITFDFCMGVQALSVDLIDIDDIDPNQSVDVTLTDGGGLTRVYSVPAGWTADGGVRTLDLDALGVQVGETADATETTDPGFDPENILSMEVRFGSSGALDNLKFCPSSPSAQAIVRNGSGRNARVLTPSSLPILGARFAANMDCSDFGPGLAVIVMRRAAATGSVSPFGEVLVGGLLLHRQAKAYSEGPTRMTWNIPYDLSLCGVEVHAQGLCQPRVIGPMTGKRLRLGGGGLTNAIDLTLGF